MTNDMVALDSQPCKRAREGAPIMSDPITGSNGKETVSKETPTYIPAMASLSLTTSSVTVLPQSVPVFAVPTQALATVQPPTTLSVELSMPASKAASGTVPLALSPVARQGANGVGSGSARVPATRKRSFHPFLSLTQAHSIPRSPSMAHASLFPCPGWEARGVGSSGPPSCAGGRGGVGLLWFRQDLRVHDHEALLKANEECSHVVPVYCFDPRDFGRTGAGFERTGPHRARFLLDCVADLRDKLRALGSDLLIRLGPPDQVLPELAQKLGARHVYAHQEVTTEEVALEEAVGAAVRRSDGGRCTMKFFWGCTLYHLADLPFGLAAMPSTYATFRQKMLTVPVRAARKEPSRIQPLPQRNLPELGEIPTMQELGLSPSASPASHSSSLPSPAVPASEPHGPFAPAPAQQPAQGAASPANMKGGEREALERLRRFVAEHKARLRGPARPGGARSAPAPPPASEGSLGANFSCKISPWLAMGCLSPRLMYAELMASLPRKARRKARRTSAPAAAGGGRAAKGQAGSGGAGASSQDNGVNWLVFELLWRDFFRFITKKYGMKAKETASAPSPRAPALQMA